MKSPGVRIGLLGLAAAFALCFRLGERASHAAEQPTIERGRYLVESVAVCQDCHTPRDKNGDYDRSRWLAGGPHNFRPVKPLRDWADIAPPLAGLPGWLNDADVVHLLMTGRRPDGRRPRPPMKEFKMSEPDAKAVVAYLRSLSPPRTD